MTAATRASRLEMVKALMQAIGLDPALPQPLSAQLFRRPAPAHRHRARPGARPRSAHLRRAGLGARRLGAGADPQPAQGSAEGARPHLSVHLAQSGGGRLHGRPHRRHVPRPHRRDRAARSAVPQAGASLYARRCWRRCPFPISTGRSISRRCKLGGASDSSAWATAVPRRGRRRRDCRRPISAAAIWCWRGGSADARELRP